jgi:cysteine-rich repeat protein
MRRPFALILCSLALGLDAGAQATFTPIGTQLGGVASFAADVSPDGNSVVGIRQTSGTWNGYRWTSGSVLNLGTAYEPLAVSRQGRAVAGHRNFTIEVCTIAGCYLATSTEAGRWMLPSGWVGIGGTPFFDGTIHTIANAISADGSVMVGVDAAAAYRWTQATDRVELPRVPDAWVDDALAVSADGDVVSGYYTLEPGTGGPWGFYRRAGDSFVRIPPLAGFEGGGASWNIVSADGATVVGMAYAGSQAAGYRWTEAGGTVALPSGGWAKTWAQAPSADGNVVIGAVANAVGDSVPAIWIGAADPVPLQDLLEDTYGLDLGGWTLFSVTGISNDGRTIVGNARDAGGAFRAFLARIPAAGAPFVCGNGIVAGNEDCDDGNLAAGDGCSATCTMESCANLLDDDGDGAIDLADAGCAEAADRSEVALVECADGLDDDRDGMIDLADTGCASAADLSEQDPTLPCDDGADNDFDQFVDYPNDPTCQTAVFPYESSRCQNGADDDGDANIDFDGGASWNGGVALGPADPECAGKPQRNNEKPTPPCGLGAELLVLVALLRRRFSAG